MAMDFRGQAEARIRPRTILAVDDDTAMGRLIATVLGRNHLVLSARNGREASRLLGCRKIDLVLTDIRMPEMDGLALAEHVRACYPGMPIAFISGSLDVLASPKAASLAPWRLPKPFRVEDLEQVVREMISASPEQEDEESGSPEAPPQAPQQGSPAPPPRTTSAEAESPGQARPRAGDAAPAYYLATPEALRPRREAAPPPGKPRAAWQSLLDQGSTPPASPTGPPAEPALEPAALQDPLPPAPGGEEAAPEGPLPQPPPSRLLKRDSVRTQLTQFSQVWEYRRRMAGGKPLLLPGESSPYATLLGPGDTVEIRDVDASMLRRGDTVYCQADSGLAYLRVTRTRVATDGSFLLCLEGPRGAELQVPESRLVGRVAAVVRRGLRLPVGTLSLYTRFTRWIQGLGSSEDPGQHSA